MLCGVERIVRSRNKDFSIVWMLGGKFAKLAEGQAQWHVVFNHK